MTRQYAPCGGFGAGLTVATVLLLAAGCGGRSVWSTGDGGTGHDGGGEVGECQGPGDCVVAWRVDECCSCYEPVSAAELAADPCLIPPEQSFVPQECWVDCSFVDCAVCPAHEWTPTCEDGLCIWLESDCAVPEDCLVGIWVNDCCTQAMPVRRVALQSDPCLVPWPVFEIPQECRDQWAEECMYINCTFSGPQSRAVTCGIFGCDYATECYQPSDCAMVLDGNTICPCPEAYPAEMVGRDECVVPAGTSIPAHCPANQVLADCVPCVEGVVPTCSAEYRCETVYPAF